MVSVTYLKYWVHTFAECRKDGWIDWNLSGKLCVKLWYIIITSLKRAIAIVRIEMQSKLLHTLWCVLTNNGLIGGSNRLANTSSQLTDLKNWWLFIGTASFAPEPKRCETCRFINFRIKSLASGVKYAGKLIFPFNIVSMVFFRFSAVNGGWKDRIQIIPFGNDEWALSQLTNPVNISYINAPNDHQSTALPWPLRVKISGALKITINFINSVPINGVSKMFLY